MSYKQEILDKFPEDEHLCKKILQDLYIKNKPMGEVSLEIGIIGTSFAIMLDRAVKVYAYYKRQEEFDIEDKLNKTLEYAIEKSIEDCKREKRQVVEVDVKLLKEIKEYIEITEEEFDGEYGEGRTNKTLSSILFNEGGMPDIYYKVCELLEEYKIE